MKDRLRRSLTMKIQCTKEQVVLSRIDLEYLPETKIFGDFFTAEYPPRKIFFRCYFNTYCLQNSIENKYRNAGLDKYPSIYYLYYKSSLENDLYVDLGVDNRQRFFTMRKNILIAFLVIYFGCQQVKPFIKVIKHNFVSRITKTTTFVLL